MVQYPEKEDKMKIDWKSLIIGAAIFTIIATIGFKYNIGVLFAISAVGLIYTGYYSEDLIYGGILGAICTIPFILINFNVDTISTGIIFIIEGAVVGLIGAYARKNREKAIKKRNIGKKKKKKIK